MPLRDNLSQIAEKTEKAYTLIGESKINDLEEDINICLIHANKSYCIFLVPESSLSRASGSPKDAQRR